MQLTENLDIDQIPSSALLVRLDGSIVRANAQSERLFGYGRGELADLECEQLIQTQQRQEWRQLLATATADPTARSPGHPREFVGVTKDGRAIAVEIVIGPAAGGTGALALIRDITTAARGLAKLSESEQLLRIGASHTTDLIQYVDVDKDYLRLYGNLNGDNFLGYELGEFPHTLSGWFELIHPEDVDRIQADIERVINNCEEGWDLRYRVRANDGSYRHVLDRGTTTGYLDGRPNEGIGGIIDETEHVVAQQALEATIAETAQEHAPVESVLNSMPHSVAVLDASGQVILVNDAWLDCKHENGDQHPSGVDGVGANYLDVCRQAAIDEPGAKKALDGIRSVLDGTSDTFRLEYSYHGRSEEMWFSMSARARKNGQGALVVHTQVTHLVGCRQELERTLSRVAQMKDRLQAESSYLQAEIASKHGFDDIIGSSDAIAVTFGQVESVAQTDATVLLLGETGSGKELVAHAIHSRSRRNDRPLINVDCGTLPANLIESELFGHEKGAFTDAHEQKIGRFELAHGGTIFLDEIGELPVDLQSKLLRVIEEGVFRRVGATSEMSADVRVIAATNRDLRLEMREGRFRSDLYYRLSVFPIEVPPLRERREDIPRLVSFFVSRYATSLGKSVRGIDQRTMDALMAYDWPGNVRELRNLIERSVILCAGDTLTVDPVLLGDAEPAPEAAGPLKQDLQAVERGRIVRALDDAGWTIKGAGNAASRLGVTPSGLRSRMKKLGITRPSEHGAV